ncbi:mitochondrial import receptor subunit TOM40 homolog 2 [Eupeodes corollae]|uniref:mitochondrial import receptor subunit TOM40 homolog 2 n=1 Tax=Eupeodes corollae TaxID=290404 RepID=UPI002492245C|nr:mitochondrial import receptor subunit TOM40 homolog 2 [Eupeodes corollae]
MKCEWCPRKCYPRFPPNYFVQPGRSEFPNPGNIEDLHSRAHNIMPKFFDGVELGYRYGLAPEKTIQLNWILSHTRPSGFLIGGVYCTRNYDDILETPMVHADINPSSLSTNFGCVYYPWQNVRLWAAFQKSKTLFDKTFSAEVHSPSTTYTANLYNPSKDRGRCTLSVLRSVTNHLALGGELLVEWNEPRHTSADAALAMRYSRHQYSSALTVSRQGFDVSYWHRVHPSIQMGSSLAFNRNTRKAIATVCYQWEFQDTTVRGMVDSDMSVGFMYYRTISHIPCGFGVSLLLSVPSNRFTFGIKMDLDPNIKCG